jgi:hypothetical protein
MGGGGWIWSITDEFLSANSAHHYLHLRLDRASIPARIAACDAVVVRVSTTVSGEGFEHRWIPEDRLEG